MLQLQGRQLSNKFYSRTGDILCESCIQTTIPHGQNLSENHKLYPRAQLIVESPSVFNHMCPSSYDCMPILINKYMTIPLFFRCVPPLNFVLGPPLPLQSPPLVPSMRVIWIERLNLTPKLYSPKNTTPNGPQKILRELIGGHQTRRTRSYSAQSQSQSST